MAAPKGNQFWKIRSKHGRDTLFETPDLLWDAACEYFDWCDKNPWHKVDYKGSAVEKVDIPISRPYTIKGLCLYLNCSENYFRNFEPNNIDSKDFMATIMRIRDTIYTQKFEGASVGVFNPLIISRDLGLKDIQEVDTKITMPNIIIEDETTAKELKRLHEDG